MTSPIFQSEEFVLGGHAIATLTISFSTCDTADRRFVSCCLRIKGDDGDLDLKCTFGLYGNDVKRFVKELQRVHELMDGQAKLVDSDGVGPSLTVSVADHRFGGLEVCGVIHWRWADGMGKLRSRRQPPPPGFRIEMCEFYLDQSCVPDIVRGVFAFFREADVDTSPLF